MPSGSFAASPGATTSAARTTMINARIFSPLLNSGFEAPADFVQFNKCQLTAGRRCWCARIILQQRGHRFPQLRPSYKIPYRVFERPFDVGLNILLDVL